MLTGRSRQPGPGGTSVISSASVGVRIDRRRARTGRLATLHPSPALLRGGAAGFAVALLALAVVMRRLDALQHPQFWAEDGSDWFAQAYNDGRLSTLFVPHSGYFQTISRLLGDVGVSVGLAAAPLVANLAALLAELAPALFLVSSRFAAVIPSLRLRILLAAIYVAVPNAEVHANITNAQWHLAILACMVLMVPGSPRRAWQVFDVATIALCGLSGPFVVLLLPVGLLRLWRTRARRDARLVALMVPFALLQGITALVNHDSRLGGPIGASAASLVRIVANRVVLAGTLSNDTDPAYLTQAFPNGLLIATALSVAAAAVLAVALWRGPLALKILDLFAVLVLGLALTSAQVPVDTPQWTTFATTLGGPRYFLIPELALLASVAWLITLLPRRAAVAVGTVVAVGFLGQSARHWSFAAYPDLNPAAATRQLDSAPRGTQVVIPINPSGWTMVLTKR